MKETLRKSLYGSLLSRLARRFGEAEPEFCSRLKPYFYEIRDAYRSNSVSIAYDDASRVAAYLLTYVPNYALLASTVLEKISTMLPRPLRVAFICGGPLPELIGLAAAVSATPTEVDVVNLDIFSEDWAWAVELTRELVQRFAPDVRVRYSAANVDLTESWNEETAALLADRQLIMLQNCWNEMYCDASLKNVVSLSERVGAGTVFCFIDQHRYQHNQRALQHVQEALAERNFVLLEDPLPWTFRPNAVAPPPIVEQFFDGPFPSDPSKRSEHLGNDYTVASLIMQKRI